MTALGPDAHQNTWDLIPWLINGTLGEADAVAVRAHMSSCDDCKAEYDRQLRLNDIVHEFAAPAPDPAIALDSISHRLPPQKPAFSPLAWIRTIIPRAFAPAGLAVSGALAAAAVILVFGLSVFEPKFETLTTPEPASEGVEIRLRFQPDASVAEVIDLMAKAGATDITGPSDTGLLRGIIDDRIAQEVVERLKSDPRVLFVAKDE